MKLVAEKYRKLKPTIDLLTDEVVMAQAWKKTHSYMRTHNWYADTLALDVSALGLQSNAKSWAKALKTRRKKPYRMELIPAAKSEKWIVDKKKGWIPESLLKKKTEKKRRKKPPLRPLAHLTMRDQTWATTAMLCLADAVETALGDCSNTNPFTARKNKVYSYGNRLLCDWKDGSGWFRWGNSEIYRKFFTDYQAFLRRPVVIGRSIASNQTDEDRIFIVSLDLSKFYDCIDRNLLIDRLRNIAVEHDDAIETDSEFWLTLQTIFDWHWRDKDIADAKKLNLELSNGLPQGLAAAGFFANAYLHKFDSEIGSQLSKPMPNNTGVIVHDYCRYVDDIRIVVSLEDEAEPDMLAKIVENWVEDLLKEHGGELLTLNTDKTAVTTLSDLDNRGSLSERIKSLQEELSGPNDRDGLENVMGVLEGLLTLQTDTIPSATESASDNELLNLARFDQDVRPDTLKRFAANRIESLMRNKRRLGGNLKATPSSNIASLDNESELLAKKLIWAWMLDPSLALVLRKALEIFPSSTLAEPIFEALFRRAVKANIKKHAINAAQANYLLADLFRSCVEFHGYFQKIDYPASSNPDALLDLAARYAQKAVARKECPDFVERQALLLLAVLKRPLQFEASKNSTKSIQRLLHAILSGTPTKLQRHNLALYEVAAQITGNNDAIASMLVEQMDSATPYLKDRVLKDFSMRGGDFWLSLWTRLKQRNDYKELLNKFRWAAPTAAGGSSNFTSSQLLSKLVRSKENGFAHEISLVKLALALIEGSLTSGLSPNQVIVAQTQKPTVRWSEIWRPDVSFSCLPKTTKANDPRYDQPLWLNADLEDSFTIYWIGMVLRAAAVGTNDFTSAQWKNSTVVGYKGLRTGWFKRRMGMMHSPEALVGEFSTVSNWIAELIRKCLQWPGYESTHVGSDEIAKISDLETLKTALLSRKRQLDDLYCSASEMPALVTSVKRPRRSTEEEFRLVTVQQILPKATDFSKFDPTLDSAAVKSRNRNHVAQLCNLTLKTLVAKNQADENHDQRLADLIVFPELAIHRDDLDLLKRLADKTQSMIFAGLLLAEKDGNLINVARWLIPDYQDTGRQWITRDQGKKHPIDEELKLGVVPARPCQHILEVDGFHNGPFRLTGAICYDATDLKLASDLKGKSDLFLIVAQNQDVTTFDTMASALHYHMYQHVALINKGEFGGSTIQAPYMKPYYRLISHAHGVDQISINVADLDLAAFKPKPRKAKKGIKTKPAG